MKQKISNDPFLVSGKLFEANDVEQLRLLCTCLTKFRIIVFYFMRVNIYSKERQLQRNCDHPLKFISNLNLFSSVLVLIFFIDTMKSISTNAIIQLQLQRLKSKKSAC